MHNPETIDLFIQKRAKGASLNLIATEIGVSKTTLVAWNKKHSAEIALAIQDLGLQRHSQASDLFDTQLTKLRSAEQQFDSMFNGRLTNIDSLPLLTRFRLWFLIQRETIRLRSLQLKNDLAAVKFVQPPRATKRSPEPDTETEASDQNLTGPTPTGKRSSFGQVLVKPGQPSANEVITTPLLPDPLRPEPKILPPDALDLISSILNERHPEKSPSARKNNPLTRCLTPPNPASTFPLCRGAEALLKR